MGYREGEGMKQDIKKINLLPVMYSREQQMRSYKYIGIGILVIECIVFAIVSVIIPHIRLKAQQATLDTLQAKVNVSKYEGVDEAMKLLEAAQAELKVWTERYETLKSSNFISVRILDSSTTSVPTGVVIQSLSLTAGEEIMGDTINLAGVASNYNAVLRYVTTLESKYGGGNVSFTADKQERERMSYYNYTIAIGSVEEITASQVIAEEDIEEVLEEDEAW